ncbi:MAG: phosphodiester glycosidase family protein [Roseinatronobacter sp.]
MMLRTARAAVLAMIALGMGAGAAQAECRRTEFQGQSFTYCDASIRDDVRLFLYARETQVYGNFRTINEALARDGKKLAFAMNASMYHPDRRPVGLFIQDGQELSRIVTSAGPGNFGLLPNGVFCIEQTRFSLTESRQFDADRPLCRDAIQSGPMLIIDRDFHPRFIPESASRLIRNGVGVSPDGQQAIFAISNDPVNFHEFAQFFRDYLGLSQALYLDGNVSRLHAPALRRSDWGTLLGPIIGKVVDADAPSN